MAFETKKYVDYAGIDEFLKKLKFAYSNNGNEKYASFAVGYAAEAGFATLDSAGKNIAATYLPSATAEETYVPLVRTIAGVDLNDNITKAELLSALGNDVEGAMEAGAQVNKVEGAKIKPSRGTDFTVTCGKDGKNLQIDLSQYALLSDVSAALHFRGTVDYEKDLPTDALVGDVYIVKYRGTSGTDPWNCEFVWADEPTAHWEELGGIVDLRNYYTKSEVDDNISNAVAAEAELRESADTTLQNNIDAEESRADTAEKKIAGDLASEVTRATAAEAKALSDAKAYTDAEIDKLDVADTVTGDYVTSVTETNGKIALVKASFGSVADESTTAVTGKNVKTYVDNKVSEVVDGLDAGPFGAEGSYIRIVSEANGVISATPVAFDTTIGDSADNKTAPTTKAAKDYTDAAFAAIQSVPLTGASSIDSLFPPEA